MKRWILAGIIVGATFGVAEAIIKEAFKEKGSLLSDKATSEPDPEPETTTEV